MEISRTPQRQLRYARVLAFTLAACTAASNGLYLYYLSTHSMVRWWSGMNALILGLFMLSLSAVYSFSGSRSGSLAIAAIGLLNLGVGFLFFL